MSGFIPHWMVSFSPLQIIVWNIVIDARQIQLLRGILLVVICRVPSNVTAARHSCWLRTCSKQTSEIIKSRKFFMLKSDGRNEFQ